MPDSPAAARPAPASGAQARPSGMMRTVAAGLVVAGLHAGLIWILLASVTRQPIEIIVPAEMIAELIAPPAPQAAPAPPAPVAPPSPAAPPAPVQPPAPAPAPAKQAVVKSPAPPVKKTAPAPQPPKPVDRAPAPEKASEASVAPAAPTAPSTANASASSKAEAATGPSATPAAPAPAPTGAASAAQGAPAAAALELPSSDAAYLQNAAPPYPALSRRLGEQGRTVVKVLIGTDGEPQKAEIATSSGFERLDRAAVVTVMRWRYVPGKRAGKPEAMWFNVPINWALKN